MRRLGIITKKIGMSAFYKGEVCFPVTLLQVEPNVVLSVTEANSKEGTKGWVVRVGYGLRKKKNISKPLCGEFRKHNLEPRAKISSFWLPFSHNPPEVGQSFSGDVFASGVYVDAQGRSKGCGFSGAMKRHGFSGLEATHGVSVSHRSHGSTGQCQDPGRVFKGKKMAGQYGNHRRTVQNLEVLYVKGSIVALKGGVPGSKGGTVFLSGAVKK